MLGTYAGKILRDGVWHIKYDTPSIGGGYGRSERREHPCNNPSKVDGVDRVGCKFTLNGMPCTIDDLKHGDQIELNGKPAVIVRATRKA